MFTPTVKASVGSSIVTGDNFEVWIDAWDSRSGRRVNCRRPPQRPNDLRPISDRFEPRHASAAFCCLRGRHLVEHTGPPLPRAECG
jgi:hypothetical protein